MTELLVQINLTLSVPHALEIAELLDADFRPIADGLRRTVATHESVDRRGPVSTEEGP